MSKFVVSRRSTGWGDCIISLISAWHYARRTGRTLVIDWRSSCYLGDPSRSAFPAYFEPVRSIGGVPVVADDMVGTLNYPTPVQVSFGHDALRGLNRWLAERNLAPSAQHVTTAYHLSHAEERALVERGEDVAAPTVVLQCSLSEGLPALTSCQAFSPSLGHAGRFGARSSDSCEHASRVRRSSPSTCDMAAAPFWTPTPSTGWTTIGH